MVFSTNGMRYVNYSIFSVTNFGNIVKMFSFFGTTCLLTMPLFKADFDRFLRIYDNTVKFNNTTVVFAEINLLERQFLYFSFIDLFHVCN